MFRISTYNYENISLNKITDFIGIIMKPLIQVFKIAIIFSIVQSSNINAQTLERQEAITAYIYNFANNIEWQNEEAINEFQFLILGEDKDVFNEMKILSNTKTLKGKPINIVSKLSLDNFDGVQLIYITKDQENSITELFDEIEGKNILLISDGFQDKRLIMINFIESGKGTLHFEINKANIINQNLRFTDDLVLFGGTEIDVAALYREGQQSLRSLQKHTDNLETDLKRLEHTITSKTQEMQVQKDSFDRQMLAQNDSLNNQTLKIQDQQKTLSNQSQLLEEKQIDISTQDQKIQEQQNILDDQYLESEKQKEELNKGIELLQDQKDKILSQTKILEEKTGTINKQQNVLYLLIIITILVIVLVLLIYNRYKSKQKLNKVLESKVKERTNELLNAKEKAERNEIEMERAQKLAHIGSWNLDLATNRVNWSKELYKMYGFDPAFPPPLLNDSQKLFTQESWELLSSSIARTGETGTPYNIELKTIRKDRSNGWMWAHGEAIKDENGKITRLWGAAQDISERKKIEEELLIAKDKAEESNEKYLNLMESLGTGVVLHAPDTSIILSNPKASEILGLSTEQMKGKKAIDPQWRFVRNDGTDMPLEEYPVNKALSLLKSFSEYFIGIKRPERKYITWVNVNASLVFDENTNIKYVTISFNDITERKLAEEELKESEEQLRTITNNLPVLISQIDKDLKYTFVNQYYYDRSPFESGIIGKDVIDVIGEETFNRALPQMKKALSGEFVSFENRTTHTKNNELIIFETNYIPHIVDGKIESFFVLGMVITERKLAEDALRESEEKLNALFTSLTEMVVMHELVLNTAGDAIDYRIIDCNKVFTEITGISKEDAIGKLATEVYQTTPPPYLEEYAKVALGGDPHEFNTFYPPLDKHLMISVVSPQAGKFATITTDISEMMQIQEMILAKNKEMENYLYVASHDLRTPLVNIQGFSQRLEKQADSIKNLFADKALEPEILHQLGIITDEDIPKTLSFVHSNIEKMDNLINGLLQLSRTGRVEMNIQEIDMNALFAKILQSLDFQIKEAQCEIYINPLPKCFGDAALLDQLFANIISNALKYSDSERVLEITVDAKKSYSKVVYTIRDTGKGIAQKHLEKIWDVFYRIGIRSGKTGEGIGLSLVKRIAEKHKGKVWAESEENKGSVFYIELHSHSFTEF